MIAISTIVNTNALKSYLYEPISVIIPENSSMNPDFQHPCPEIKETEEEEENGGKEEAEEEIPPKVEATISTHDIRERDPRDICSPLPYILPSITVQWRKNLRKIYNASLKVIDKDMESWIALLLDHLSPIELLQSVQNLPNMNDLRPIVDKLNKRYQYHVQNDYKLTVDRKHAYEKGQQDIPPPVTILVFGGSVTAGTLCRFNPLDIKISPPRRRCAWPFRLEYFINTMLGFDAVYIQSDALGGTNTELAIQRYQYGLLPESMPNPDIVINSYSSNDMHILSMHRAESMNISLYEAVWDLIQEFVRTVRGTQQECQHDSNTDTETNQKKTHQSPLIIYLDDYVGNEQDEVLETMAFSSALKTIAKYYRIMSVSYADAIRHIVYADTRETWFSSKWYENDEYVRQVHPTIGGHLSIMWVIAFNLWNSITTFCNEESALIELQSNIQSVKRSDGSVYSYMGGEDMPLIQMNVPVNGWPSTIPQGLIPELKPSLKLSEISKQWKESTLQYNSKCSDLKTISSSLGDGKPCPFSWITNVDGMESVYTLTQKMNEVLVQQNGGWEAVKDHDKLGYSPVTDSTGHPHFTMEIKAIQKPIRSVNFLTIRSYGERWKDSRISIQIYRTNKNEIPSEKVIEPEELVGFHLSETSVSYSDSIAIEDGKTEVGDTIQIIVTLVGGQTFKINGISICYL